MILYMYIAPEQGRKTPWGVTFDVNRKSLSLRPFVASFKQIYLNSDFYTHFLMFFHMYEGCLEITETIAIFSKRLNIIQTNLHSHQVPHIWVLGLNYLTAIFNGYDPVAFQRLIPPLHRSMSQNIGIHCKIP